MTASQGAPEIVAVDADVWVFDCDGVLLDSNAMKSDGFGHVLSPYPEGIVKEFLSYQKGTFGMSRFRLIEAFFDQFLKRAPEAGETDALLTEFGAYCRQAYPKQPVTPGTVTLLTSLASASIPAYVASGSAQDELRDVLTEIGLAPHFVEIYGSPTPKADILADLRTRHPEARFVLFGDAEADYRAAAANDADFVYISQFTAAPEAMQSLQQEAGFPCAPTLSSVRPSISTPPN